MDGPSLLYFLKIFLGYSLKKKRLNEMMEEKSERKDLLARVYKK
jgi:hypothetical protein